MKSILKMQNELLKSKGGVMGQIVGTFILVLIIAVVVGMTFLFVAQLKTQVLNTAGQDVNSTAYKAINTTEAAGATLVSYLPMVFLALIFGVILVVVLRVVLPYINIGGGGFN
jgi:hypothetical protein